MNLGHNYKSCTKLYINANFIMYRNNYESLEEN